MILDCRLPIFSEVCDEAGNAGHRQLQVFDQYGGV
jgi:hypothetical protein